MRTEVTFFQERIRGLPVLRVRGKIRMPDLERWGQELEALVERAEDAALLDMTCCPFFPSLGLPPLITAHARMDKAGGRLLIAVGEELGEVIRFLRLENILHLFPDLDGCLGATAAEAGD